MCLRKLFPQWFEPEPEPIPANRKLLTFGKNNYGGGNNLNGCVNDSNNIEKKVIELFPDFAVFKFIDSQATASKYLTEVEKAVSVLSNDATILVLADSCFSESVTRLMNSPGHPTKARFLDPGLPPRKTKSKPFRAINHILISGCEDHATSADAYINGSYQGAFTYFAIKTLKKGITYKQWFTELLKQIKAAGFEQTPVLEGPEYLINRVVFEDETLIIHNSSHGSYTYDKNGDESDGQDEGIYFDRLLVDDEISNILSKFGS